MFLEPLALNLCMTPGDALACLTQPKYVRAAIPIEERLSILSEGEMTCSPVGFEALKYLDNEAFGFAEDFLTSGMKCLFS